MRRHTALRIGLTLVTSAALVAPYAAQVGCAGRACCASAMAAHHHESPGNAFARHAATPNCPTMTACNIATSATPFPAAGGVPLLPETIADDAQPSAPYRSPAPVHRTPPPRA